ncbi:TRAP transporter substrate-binding protein [Saezia sanguinis]|uniref:TRAP transporter substrate-binding protein n=1 Tax=Saezia sanguinis TaxID=1965230 RepID=UPI003043E25D
MERRRFVKGAGIAGIVAAASAPAIVYAQQQLRWRIASSFPKTLDTVYGGAEIFVKNVSEATSGKFTISLHSAGELVPAFGVVDAVQQGTIDIAHTCGYYFVGKDETFAIDTSIPFGMNARQMNAWMYDGNGMKLLRDFFSQYNIVNLPVGNTGAQMGGWFRKEIRSVADVNGIKFRIGGFGGKVFSELGVIPQNLPGGEIYTALEKGTLDAAEWIGPYDDLKLGLHKVAPYYYSPSWWEGSTQFSLYINANQWATLSKEYQNIVRQAASDAHVAVLARYDRRNPEALKQLIAQGAKLQRFPKDVMDAAFKARNKVYAELMDSNPNWKKIYPDYAKFLAESYQWIPVADGLYDQYMAAQKL